MDIYDKMKVLKSIRDYADSGALPFHMPGHKRGKIFHKLGLNHLLDDIMFLDTTEVIGVDNLHSPEGPIKEAQEMAARSFGAEHSFFLSNGTTSGIYAMILASTSPGDKIIIPRNAHRSVISACILGRLHPCYIYPEVDPDMGIAMGVTAETVEDALNKHMDAKALVITNPTYYGVCSDIKAIADLVHEHGKILLVDEAHGSHFIFNEKLSVCAMNAGADMAAQSTHKTLLSMTGSSMLHLKSDNVDIEKVRFFLQLVQTTSPSHVLLASLDVARYIMDEYGESLLDECIKYSDLVRKEINDKTCFYCLDSDKIAYYGVKDIDPTRIAVCVKEGGISGSEGERILREKFNVQVEMSDMNNLVAITSLADDKEEYDGLKEAIFGLEELTKTRGKKELFLEFPGVLTRSEIAPFEAIYKKTKAIDIESSVGHISAEMIIPYPPGIPIIMPGERINQEIVDYVLECKEQGIKLSNIADWEAKRIKTII